MRKLLLCYIALCIVLGGWHPLMAMHNISRYFPFLEKPEPYPVRHIATCFPAGFFTDASSSFTEDKGGGIPEVFGTYDLADVIESLKKVSQASGKEFIDPFEDTERPDFAGESLPFKMSGRIKSRGITFAYEQNLFWQNLSIGFWIPFMEVTSSIGFTSRDDEGSSNTSKALSESQRLLVDKVRRQVQATIGLKAADSVRTGFGDLDVHLRWHNAWEYVLAIRKINLVLQAGLLIPTGKRRQIDNPAAIPFMGNGHFGYHFDAMPEFELKDNWKLGFIFGLNFQSHKSRNTRINVGHEPLPFSAFIGPLRVRPGYTWKISTYFTLDNLIDGFNLQFRHTFLKHNEDKITDQRSKEDRDKLFSDLDRQENFSVWRANYVTFQLSYDSKAGAKRWPYEPVFYAIYDLPVQAFGGARAAKTHQVTLGVEFNF